jgi:opacity protein-like surface antigen
MRNYLLAAVAVAALATPAYARDGSPYVGIEGGILFPETKDINGNITYTNPAVPQLGGAPIGRERFKKGYDLDVIGGFDLGMFRVEGELGYKHSKVKNFNLTTVYLQGINTPAGTNFTGNTIGWTRNVSVYDAMLNGMIDVGDSTGWSGFAGGGVGYAHFKELGRGQSSPAWQAFAGVRFPVSDSIDVGLKYRYFRSFNRLNFNDAVNFPAVGTGTTGGTAFINSSQHFSSHSLLLSLVYNFVPAAAPPPPPPPPAPPPPPPPATQTCPDGSVIPATSTCPAPPPPPPPPPPPAQRGERGE